MNQITQAEAVANAYAPASKPASAEKAGPKKSPVAGATIGSPELTEKGKKYYEQLKAKYSNMDFILVSEDKKMEAQKNAGKYANANRMVVLIDTNKIERMAEDEKYRKQYEGLIATSATQLNQLKEGLGTNGSAVKTYGMQVKEGTASFFAVVDKSLAAQKKRLEKNAAKKAQDKKDAKKASEEKKADQKKAEKEQEEKKAGKPWEDGDTVTVTAKSIEELIKKVNDAIFSGMSDYVRTEEESWIGGNLDFYG